MGQSKLSLNGATRVITHPDEGKREAALNLPRHATMESSHTELETYLKVLAHGNRLELLQTLRTPRTLDEIHLTPSAGGENGSPDRNMTRQGIQNHLNKLIDAGIVRVTPTDRKGKRGILEYHLDSARLFAIVEELRKVTREPVVDEIDPLATQALTGVGTAGWTEGPKIVLVHGVREGRVFPLLQKDLRPPRGWLIGRSPGVPVRLDYDPFVSLENAEIIQERSDFALLDLRTSKNGTYLNWRRLPAGARVPLESGDVIGVGRTLLVFRPD